MRMLRLLILLNLFALAGVAGRAEPASLRVGVAQIGVVKRHEENLAKILRYTRKAAESNCRVVVFPEGALREVAQPRDPTTSALLQKIQQAASRHRIYIILGLWSRLPPGPPPPRPRGFNWMVVIDPDGKEIFRYEKLYDHREAELPRVFHIDGIPCNAWICADRWLRAVAELPVIEESRISFELSDNMKSEWVPELGWYAYVPRALRTNTFLVFANTAASAKERDRHGHSAVIAPDGRLVTAAFNDREQLLVADLDVAQGTRAEALRRAQHPVFRKFWETGRAVRDGEPVEPIAAWARYTSPVVSVTVAAAQMRLSRDPSSNIRRMEEMIAQAGGKADVIAFPAMAVTGPNEGDVRSSTPDALDSALSRIRSAAKKYSIYVIFGMPGRDGGSTDGSSASRPTNRACVVGPDGEILTSYDQMAVERPDVFKAGASPEKMWFRVKGVPAAVSVGRDALWSEIGELAAFSGAQLLFNLTCEEEAGSADDLRRLQIAATFASYLTLTVITSAAGPTDAGNFAGAGQTTVWDDLRGAEEMRAAVQHLPGRPGNDQLAIFASFAANCVARAGKGEEILYTTRTVNAQNPFREDSHNPRMRPWYWFGAQTITGCLQSSGGSGQ